MYSPYITNLLPIQSSENTWWLLNSFTLSVCHAEATTESPLIFAGIAQFQMTKESHRVRLEELHSAINNQSSYLLVQFSPRQVALIVCILEPEKPHLTQPDRFHNLIK